MIERHGTHVCKNPDCCGLIAWTVFLQKERLKEDKPITVTLPITNLKGGETVTLQYNGRLKVKGVKATSDEKATE